MNCKPGDLAIVVGVTYPVITPGIEGRVVEVLRLHIPGEQFFSDEGMTMYMNTLTPCWVVKSSRPLPWLCNGGPNSGKVFMMWERPIADATLRPIGGVPIEDEVTEEITA